MKTFEFKVHITAIGEDIVDARQTVIDALEGVIDDDNHVTGFDIGPDDGEEITGG